MTVALRTFRHLTEAGEDPVRARVVAEGFEQLEESQHFVLGFAREAHIQLSERRLQREIEKLRLEVHEIDAQLRKDLDAGRLEAKQVGADLLRDLGAIRLEIEAFRLELRKIEAALHEDTERSRRETREMEMRLTRNGHRQTLWIIASIGLVIGALRALDWWLGTLAPH